MLQDYKFDVPGRESYVGPVFDTAYYAETLGSYGLMDFRLGVGKQAWTASLFGTNLTNKHAGLTIDNTVFACSSRRSRVSRPISRARLDWRSKRSS